MIKRTQFLTIILCLFISLCALSSCSLFSPVKMKSATSYVINRVPDSVPEKSTTAINLLVIEPQANNIYNTLEMAYTTRPYEIGYFANNRWAETPPQMIHPLIIQTLQKTHYFHSVGAIGTINAYDFILNTQLIQLQQDYSHVPSTVHLVLRAEIMRANTSRVIATKEFSITEPIAQNTPYGGVSAVNKATEQLLQQLAEFCLQKIR